MGSLTWRSPLLLLCALFVITENSFAHTGAVRPAFQRLRPQRGYKRFRGALRVRGLRAVAAGMGWGEQDEVAASSRAQKKPRRVRAGLFLYR